MPFNTYLDKILIGEPLFCNVETLSKNQNKHEKNLFLPSGNPDKRLTAFSTGHHHQM